MTSTILAIVLATAAGSSRQQPEPAARTLTAAPLRLTVELADVAAVRELTNGHLLISDAGAPAILVVDPARGSVRKIGREGRGPNEFTKPGGIYYDTAGAASYIVDRGQARVFVIDGTGNLTAMRSIEQRGTQSAADKTDPRRVDAAMHSYFVNMGSVFRPDRAADSIALLRFDVAQQRGDTIARLFRTKPTVVSQDGPMTFSRTPVFSPADGWAVAPDGSIAVVRANPYRVDWVAASGQVTRGAAAAYSAVEVTDDDRNAFETTGTASVSGGASGSGRQRTITPGKMKPAFAATKPAFDPDAVVMGPDGRVWVGRYGAATAKSVVYDIFDRRGVRVDRVALPVRSRLVGFGPNVVYVIQLDEDDVPHLRKFRL